MVTSCYKSFLEITMSVPKNRAQVNKELGSRELRTGKVLSEHSEPGPLGREFSELLKAIVWART